MRLTKMAILAVFILLPYKFIVDVQQDKIIQNEFLKNNYSELMSIATFDASSSLIKSDYDIDLYSVSEGYINNKFFFKSNLDKSLSKFYQSLYLNMGLEDDPIGQSALKHYIPIKMIVDYDGLHINTWSETLNVDNGKISVDELWLPKKAYTYYDEANNLIINFTLDDYLFVFDVSTATWHKGRRNDIEAVFSSSVFSEKYFEMVRKKTITDIIKNELEYYTSSNNSIAYRNGWTYRFNIPYLDDNFQNSINDISFIAFMQGIPLNGGKYYNNYGFSVSSIVNKNNYPATSINGQLLYHKENCSTAINADKVYNSKIDAVKDGYYPCDICKP